MLSIWDSSKRGLKKDGTDWRCVEINKLLYIKIEDGEWHTGEIKYNKRSTCVDQVDVCVEGFDIGN